MMKRTATLLAALALACTAMVAAPATAAYQIPTEQITCTSDLSRLQIVDGKVQFTARLAIGGVKPDDKPQHYWYAQYVDIKVGVQGELTRYPLEVQYFIKNTDRCVIAKLAAPLIKYDGQERAVVKMYEATTGAWGSTDWYRNLDGRG